MKGHSAQLVTSDVLVLCDSDCRYQQGWLENILAPFQDGPDVHSVAGGTTTRFLHHISAPYSLAVALTFISLDSIFSESLKVGCEAFYSPFRSPICFIRV